MLVVKPAASKMLRESSKFPILLLLLGVSSTRALELPSPLQRCQPEDQDCLIAQVQSYFQHFSQGIPELKVPSLDPLELGVVRALNNDPSGALSFNLVLTNTSLHLLSKAQLTSIKGFTRDLSKPLKLTWILSAKNLEVHATYDVKGKIIMLPIVSKGHVVIRLNDVQTKSRVSAVPEKRDDGKYYLKLTEHKSVSKVGSGNFSMSNSTNINPALADSMLSVLNNDWEALSADIQPRITEAYDRSIKRIIESLWNAVPYDDFFNIV
ncbi:circadian clock-controlled protein daywake-like [Drosophila sulfurigaster albostrigata]|uniref:circadian clock-controlled protein daywake-like n=1 Tax=Drosophila sulfurigaster albostrigata TaxID=89887 RepID=UPI002D21CA0D|nr:circadian clock-controlled protein daywake-like [Drosophila sulfurigaster albostrigata]